MVPHHVRLHKITPSKHLTLLQQNGFRYSITTYQYEYFLHIIYVYFKHITYIFYDYIYVNIMYIYIYILAVCHQVLALVKPSQNFSYFTT